jgi:hypothetical protein
MAKDDYSAFHALDPFFSVVMEGLRNTRMVNLISIRSPRTSDSNFVT